MGHGLLSIFRSLEFGNVNKCVQLFAFTNHTTIHRRALGVCANRKFFTKKFGQFGSAFILTKQNFSVMSSSSKTKANDDGPILESCYEALPLPKLTTGSICELLINKAQEHVKQGRTKWLTDTVTGETLTFADVEPMSRQAASAMVKRGMVKNDIALYMTMDVTKVFTTILGIWRVGGIMYSSYPEDTPDTLLTRLQQSKAKWVFCDPASVPQVRIAVEDPSVDWSIEIILFGPQDQVLDGCTHINALYEDDGSSCPTKIDSKVEDPILILCTSGTTGKSKGAIYTNQCLLSFCLGLGGIPRNEKPALLLLRGTHVLGCLFPLRNIHVGVYSIMLSVVNRLNIFKAVDEYKPILAFGFPLYLQLLTTPEAQQYDRTSLEAICTGGMVLTPQYYETMMKGLPNLKYVINGYGLTECGALTTTVDLSPEAAGEIRAVPETPHLSVGRLYGNTFLRVVSLQTGKSLGPNQQGELVIKSPVMSTGYWNQPEEDKATFVDGWLHTGDLGYYDDGGFIFVVDRIKETFKYFNNHISPAEMEEFLLRHPAVAEACCFGIRDPDGGDHIPRAVVVLRPDMVGKTTGKEVQNFVDSQVAPYKKLRGGVFIVPELPRGKTGKVVRNMVAAMDLF